MEGLRLPELIIILILIAVLFGPQKVAGIGAGLGKAIRGFKDAVNQEDDAKARAPGRPDGSPTEPIDGTARDAREGPQRDTKG